jgi:hypothetical protein
VEDARALDEVANDLAANYMLDNHAFYSCYVHSIIQRGRAARSRQRRKPTAERRRWLRYQLAHEHVGSLRAAPEAALPHQLGALARIVRLQRGSEHVMKGRRAATVAAFGASANNDLEATRRCQSFERTRLASR